MDYKGQNDGRVERAAAHSKMVNSVHEQTVEPRTMQELQEQIQHMDLGKLDPTHSVTVNNTQYFARYYRAPNGQLYVYFCDANGTRIGEAYKVDVDEVQKINLSALPQSLQNSNGQTKILQQYQRQRGQDWRREVLEADLEVQPSSPMKGLTKQSTKANVELQSQDPAVISAAILHNARSGFLQKKSTPRSLDLNGEDRQRFQVFREPESSTKYLIAIDHNDEPLEQIYCVQKAERAEDVKISLITPATNQPVTDLQAKRTILQAVNTQRCVSRGTIFQVRDEGELIQQQPIARTDALLKENPAQEMPKELQQQMPQDMQRDKGELVQERPMAKVDQLMAKNMSQDLTEDAQHPLLEETRQESQVDITHSTQNEYVIKSKATESELAVEWKFNGQMQGAKYEPQNEYHEDLRKLANPEPLDPINQDCLADELAHGKSYDLPAGATAYIPEVAEQDSMTADEVCRAMAKGEGNSPFTTKRMKIENENGELQTIYQTFYLGPDNNLYAVMSVDGEDNQRHLTGECYRIEWNNDQLAVSPLEGSTAGDEVTDYAAAALGYMEEHTQLNERYQDSKDAIIARRKEQYDSMFKMMSHKDPHAVVMDTKKGSRAIAFWGGCMDYVYEPQLKEREMQSRRQQESAQVSHQQTLANQRTTNLAANRGHGMER